MVKEMDTKHSYKSDLEKLKNKTDEEIDLSDIPEQGEEFFKNARLWISPETISTESVMLTIDHDVLEWFKAQGEEEYSRRINAALRIYAEAHRQKV